MPPSINKAKIKLTLIEGNRAEFELSIFKKIFTPDGIKDFDFEKLKPKGKLIDVSKQNCTLKIPFQEE